MPIKALVFDAYGTLFDVQSVAAATEAAFPGHGATITQIWRLKQLEYTWLRALMGRYEDFWTVTTESLDFTLKTLGLTATPAFLAEIAGAYDGLALYPEARAALQGLASYRLAIFSNGSPAMLKRLVAHAGIGEFLETVISVDEIGVYKPDPRGYAHVEKRLGLSRDEILFVSSNGFDIAGAKAHGFTVARIERVPAAALRIEIEATGTIDPKLMFKALRLQPEQLGFHADVTIAALTDLVSYAAIRNLPGPSGSLP
ncbi:haloacid dehalogenase type II [Bosea sp. SSUT16]|uniref:(S)-2-haloacid dehalogenase n=1 Tax=Bosea spartocytisi TaxID=2773451 RepID=A0A927EDC8_9HYPH|nr:haloacid dehalogenase type II [Bosea spartocytisi]MBD3848730.1 haloacid dehalogenase type II [Bosea spartocytisi]MCT4473810.1 haloacid dehalogenase type II [Bosea spartocytisi]